MSQDPLPAEHSNARMSASRWVVGAALLGALCSTLFSSILCFPRDVFVGLHVVAVVGFLFALVRVEGFEPRVQFRRRWAGGLVAGALIGALLARTVVTQPASVRPSGANLVWALLWDGGLYGIVDALLLSVLPVLLVYGARPVDELRNPAARWGWGLSALLASMFPIAPILSHVVMHIAAVLHGMATTVLLPPH